MKRKRTRNKRKNIAGRKECRKEKGNNFFDSL